MKNKELAKQFGINVELLNKLDKARPIYRKKMTEKLTKAFLGLMIRCKKPKK
jgi:ribosome-binding protein aMBF1 (putative translation factor)